jgi:hypothetical protein
MSLAPSQLFIGSDVASGQPMASQTVTNESGGFGFGFGLGKGDGQPMASHEVQSPEPIATPPDGSNSTSVAWELCVAIYRGTTPTSFSTVPGHGFMKSLAHTPHCRRASQRLAEVCLPYPQTSPSSPRLAMNRMRSCMALNSTQFERGLLPGFTLYLGPERLCLFVPLANQPRFIKKPGSPG